MIKKTGLRFCSASMTLFAVATLSFGTASAQTESKVEGKAETIENKKDDEKKNDDKATGIQIYYLEIVTPDVDAACKLYSKMYGVKFGDPIREFGGARTAKLAGGGMLGIRGPLRSNEEPVVRPYVLVDDIKAAVKAAKDNGATIAMAPTKMPTGGQFAILIQGGIESGLWQK